MAATELDLFATHEVLNQAPPLAGHDVFGTDVALAEGLEREGAAWADDELHQLGREAGDPDWQERGRLANQNPPDLVSHDRYGHRVDAVRYHPAYHELMGQSVAHGLHAAPWADDRPGAHVARAAKIITWYQVDGGQGSGNVICLDVLRALARAP